MNYRRNNEGYYDPTAGEALERIAHEERRKRRQQRLRNRTGAPEAATHERTQVPARPKREEAAS